MKKVLVFLVCVSTLGLVVGCTGGSKNDFSQKVEMDFTKNIKSDLEAIAKSGRLGSGMQTLLSNVNALKQKDPAKADAIRAGLDEIMNMNGEAKIKAKAAELLKLL